MSRIHTPRYSSQPSGRRFISTQHQIIESVLPDDLVAQIRTTQFDEMLQRGFYAIPFNCLTNDEHKPIPSVPTLKLTLTPSNARDVCSWRTRLSRFII
ncbi:hypothetical protein DSO57_1029910 [Entomophthora muscae]|uniref:Uncharacterized protein n=1 Tax=Entomophthora muscae TaxID=34485 RepID=A0ACC2S2X5_9FUNG|nr:hypothetical protein DSO57_1029910 [Entomophthora muscae]